MNAVIPMRISIIIRTLNEAEHLDDLLMLIARQEIDGCQIETLLVDSGSTDGTLDIAARHGVRLEKIDKADFSFGRSLNRGCAVARGDALVFISGHCVPVNTTWLRDLCAPVLSGQVAYSYGRQIGDDESNYSERRIFAKYFPERSAIPQDGFFCNNANAALSRSVWQANPFNEELTGLEDIRPFLCIRGHNSDRRSKRASGHSYFQQKGLMKPLLDNPTSQTCAHRDLHMVIPLPPVRAHIYPRTG